MGAARLPDIPGAPARPDREGGPQRLRAAVLNTGAADCRTVEDLLAAGESQRVEFKSTARNAHTGEADKRLEHVIVKTVCGFLNAEGGTLLVGVDDEGQILGLQADMASLRSRATPDGYELFLRQLIDSQLSIPSAGVVRIEFEGDPDQQVCKVTVAASGRPVFARPLDGGHSPTDSGFASATRPNRCMATTWWRIRLITGGASTRCASSGFKVAVVTYPGRLERAPAGGRGQGFHAPPSSPTSNDMVQFVRPGPAAR